MSPENVLVFLGAFRELSPEEQAEALERLKDYVTATGNDQ